MFKEVADIQVRPLQDRKGAVSHKTEHLKDKPLSYSIALMSMRLLRMA